MARAHGHNDGVEGGIPAQPYFDPVNSANPGQFGQDTGKPKSRIFLLDAVTADQTIALGASTFIWVRRASSATASMDVTFDHDRTGSLRLTQGFFLSGMSFSILNLTHAAQAGEWIEIVYGPLFSPNAVNPSEAVSTFTPEPRSALTVFHDSTLATTTVHPVLAANAKRQRAVVQNVGPDDFRVGYVIGGSGVSSTTGFILTAGESMEFFGTGQISIWTPTPNCSVTALEEATT